MARTKNDFEITDITKLDKASKDLADKLGEAFSTIITNEYGYARSPKPLMTPFNIKPLDALFGGGIVSSAPVMFSSTPETGKSTVAFQFSKIFQNLYENSVVVYLDIEGSGNVAESSEFQVSRIESFGLDPSRFKYEPIMVDVIAVFEVISKLIQIKKAFEEKLKKEFYLLIIWDSIASTPSSKVDGADDPNKTIGVKARQLTFCLEKYSPLLAYNRITLLTIDQVRANLKIEGPYVSKEKSVGEFKDFKAASSISALNHRISQWMFMSKKKQITPADGFGIDGWYIDFFSEKNKYAPSKNAITCVFDKSNGIDKFWTEYLFISEMTPTEEKIYKGKKFPYPFMIVKSGAWVQLKITNPQTKEVEYSSEKFYKKDAKLMYQTDKTFRDWFDYAVNMSVHFRIKEGIFKCSTEILESIDNDITEENKNVVNTILDDNNQQPIELDKQEYDSSLTIPSEEEITSDYETVF